jgi:hypothetical protein
MKEVLKTMFLTKLVVGAIVLSVAGQPAPAPKRPPTEVEALRRENELLKLNLEVVLEKLRSLRGEAGATREKDPARLKQEIEVRRSDLAMWEERAAWSKRMSERKYTTVAQAEADQARLRDVRLSLRGMEVRLAVQEAEAALKRLRQNPNDKEAAESLERAVKQLRPAQK